MASSSHRRSSIRVPTRSVAALRYGLALGSVGLALLLIQLLKPVAAYDLRPALLVAIAVSALYGGLGPGLLALVLAALAAPEPVLLAAGVALAIVCGTFRRTHSRPSPTNMLDTSEDAALAAQTQRSNRLDAPAAGTLSESAKAPPPFLEITTEATWRFQHEQPLDITLPEDEQVEHLYLYSVLAECNDAFARMYGFRTAVEVIGTRLVVFLPPSNPENVAYLRSFIRSGYRLEDAESHEIDRYGNAKYFINNLVGIFERGQLVGAWGTQRDITGLRRGDNPQDSRSRLHSSKS